MAFAAESIFLTRVFLRSLSIVPSAGYLHGLACTGDQHAQIEQVGRQQARSVPAFQLQGHKRRKEQQGHYEQSGGKIDQQGLGHIGIQAPKEAQASAGEDQSFS